MSATSRTIDGQAVMFPRLTAKQVVDLCEAAYQVQRAAILDDKMGGDDISDALAQHREKRGDLRLLWRYIWTQAGALDVISRSNPTACIDSLERWDTCTLAGEICGFDMTPVKHDSDDGDGVPPRPRQTGDGRM